MTDLALPRPDNVRTRHGVHVTSDVYRIAERVKEVDPNLYIYAIDPPQTLGDKTYAWSVVELCRDGVERLVFRTEELDARIIERLQYLLRVPFEQRFAEAERLEAKAEEERREADLDTLYERMGEPMLRQLHHDGFSQRRSMYPARGVKPR